MNHPAIAVIIPVYNGEKYIREAVASVQAQSLKNLHILIADDGSTDTTRAIVAEMALADSRIKVLALEHKGVSAALNAALKATTADYISFLDADDLWQSEKLQKQLQALTVGKARICFCMMQEFETTTPGEVKSHGARTVPLKGYSKIAFLGARQVFQDYGLFEEGLAIGDFVEWFSRVLRAEEPVMMLEEVLAYRRVHGENTTRNLPKNAFLKLLKTHLDENRKALG